jgi:hypothetical protein
MAKKASLFIDHETLGKWDSSIILSTGVTILSDDMLKQPLTYAELVLKHTREFKFKISTQKSIGRTFEQNTLEGWKSQGDEARRALLPTPDDLDIEEVFPKIEGFLAERGLSWKHDVRTFDRNSFDMSKLQHLWEASLGRDGKKLPWDYRENWEIATLLKFMSPQENRYGSIDPYKFEDPAFIYHSAGCDAALDAWRFYNLMNP